MKVYVVCWGSAGQDDDGNAVAFSNIHNVYAFQDDAKKGLEECKQNFINELVNDPDFPEEDKQKIKDLIIVYGSVNDDYFEIDYTIGDTPCEVYITIAEKEIIE